MSPHADSGISSSNGFRKGFKERGEKTAPRKTYGRSHLRPAPVNELHDLVCVGFGPASLAIAVALHDSIEDSIKTPYLHTLGQAPRVAFLERQSSFAWHSGMLIDGAKMQISFIKDMATLRNPRSEFTFLNYLHSNNRLVEFTNLDTFLPQRVEYEDYMRWCANWFDDVVSYSQEVVQVTPEKPKSGGKVESFIITSRNTMTNEITTLRSRHVVIAVGGKPNIPKYFPQNHPKVIHSSQYTHSISKVLPNPRHPYRVAVIGSGQSAAEIFDNLHSRYPNSRTNLLIRGSALKPSDDSPFVNEVFNPSRVDDIYQQDSALRAAAVENNKNTNYGVVRLGLIEKLYETLYTQRIRYSSESEWPHNILTHRNVTRIENSGAIPGGLRLHVQNRSGDFFANAISNDDEILDVDLIIVATGYRRNMHEEILRDAKWLLPTSNGSEAQWTPSRDYRVQLNSSLVSSDAGIWLQGCNEKTHGLSDTLLSVISVRGGEVVQSIFGKGLSHNSAQKATETHVSNGYSSYPLDPLTKQQSERSIESHAVQAATGHALGAAGRH